MCAAGALRGKPASTTATRRRARPSTSAALRPAAPPPTTTTSYPADTFIDLLSCGCTWLGPSLSPSCRHSWLEHDYSCLPGAQRRPRVVLVAEVMPPRPEAITLIAVGGTSPDGTDAVLELDLRVGLRLKVQPPRRLGIGPAIHRQRDEVGPVFVVADDRDPRLARTPPNRVEPHRAKRVRLRFPKAASTSGCPIDGAMHHPGDTNEQARRKPWAAASGRVRPPVVLEFDSIDGSSGCATRRLETARGVCSEPVGHARHRHGSPGART